MAASDVRKVIAHSNQKGSARFGTFTAGADWTFKLQPVILPPSPSWDAFWRLLASCGSPSMPALFTTSDDPELPDHDVPRQRIVESLRRTQERTAPLDGQARHYAPSGDDSDLYERVDAISLPPEPEDGETRGRRTLSLLHLNAGALTI